jgi:hypothetical protein
MILCGRTFVVSPNGNDRADGTASAPFRSLGRAAGIMVPGDTCLVHAGTYRETIRPASSGTSGHPLVFRAWPGERPCITGTDILINWKQVEGDIWCAPMDWTYPQGNQIFIDGKPGQEARWPKKTNTDPLDWEGADYDIGSTPEYLLCHSLPSRPDGYWKDAILWMMAGAKWTSWSARITDYNDAERKLTFSLSPEQGAATDFMSPAEPRGGFFYLVGNRHEISQTGEWFLDENECMLYLKMAPGVDPNTCCIEAKKRTVAFDLNEREHIEIDGVDIHGATMTLLGSKHCLLSNIRANWISHYRGGNSCYRLGVDLGILVSGTHNTIRNSEIAYSAGNGIHLGGSDHAVINCWIHDTDYTGCYDAPIKTAGERMLISHNTIHDTGRDCLQPAGQAHIIQYNNIFRMGRLAHDLGAIYVVGSDGGGTEIHHNWIHDNVAEGTRLGIYLDNFCSNYLVYHNVTWNISGCGIRLNKPSLHNYVLHNTILGGLRNWGRWLSDWLYDCIYANNAVTGTIAPHPQSVLAGNLLHVAPEDLNQQNFMCFSGGQDQAIPIPGITSKKMAIGAYGCDVPWRPGHDFDHPPAPEYQQVDTPLRNLVQHGSFDSIRFKGSLGPWKATGTGSATIINGKGGITSSYVTRDSIIGSAVELRAQAPDGIEQTVSGLRPNQTYELTAWVKCTGQAIVQLALPECAVQTFSTLLDQWEMLRMRFTTGYQIDRGTVQVTKKGAGNAYIDDVALSGIVEGLEPQHPGMAPTTAGKIPRSGHYRQNDPLLVPAAKESDLFGGTSLVIEESVTRERERIPGTSAKARLSHRDGTIYIKTEITTSRPISHTESATWGKDDGVMICFAYPDDNAEHPVFILQGYPCGSFASTIDAGAPAEAAAVLARYVAFNAYPSETGWTTEWAIPLASVDIDLVPGLILDFNIVVFLRASRHYLHWSGTYSEHWDVGNAGRIRFV